MKRKKYSNKSFLSRRLERKSKKRFYLTLIICAVLLYILVAWFIPNFIGSLSLLNRFKEPVKSQESITENASLAPPVLNIPYEATSSAQILVKGYSLSNTKVEIYLDGELKSSIDTSGDGSFVSEPIDLSLGTNKISGITIDSNGNKSLSSKPILIVYSNEKPILEIQSPTDNQEINGGDKKVTVTGKTNSDKDISITINGTRTIVDSDGKFSRTIDINEGENNITIIATDIAGNSIQVTRKVTYKS
ncbi:MAG: hypothetical protein PHQ59_03140 [Candidatus Daviesbacteria bacterium]|nr:hypothetical protein [Candidatus Daviesbacteria bacterium]